MTTTTTATATATVTATAARHYYYYDDDNDDDCNQFYVSRYYKNKCKSSGCDSSLPKP